MAEYRQNAYGALSVGMIFTGAGWAIAAHGNGSKGHPFFNLPTEVALVLSLLGAVIFCLLFPGWLPGLTRHSVDRAFSLPKDVLSASFTFGEGAPNPSMRVTSPIPEHPDYGDRKDFINADLRIFDLLDGPPTLEGATLRGCSFKGCRISGPALIAFVGRSSMDNVRFDEPSEMFLWVYHAEDHPGNKIVGLIIIDNCSFEYCTFKLIGILGHPEDIALTRKKILDAPTP